MLKNFDNEKKYNEITYYPSDYNDNSEKPKKNYILRALMAVVCVSVISAISISGYKIYDEFSERNSVMAEEMHSGSTVSQTGEEEKTDKKQPTTKDIKTIISQSVKKAANRKMQGFGYWNIRLYINLPYPCISTP